MTEAARLAAEGAEHGTVVAALEQTAGQGRQGREWLSMKGDGLYCTFILRFDVSASDLPCVTLGLGLAVVDALAPLVAAPLDIRWPNDILCDGKKLCGILARLEYGAVLAGIGVNLNQTSFPAGLRTPATSLRLLEGKVFPPQDVLALLEAPVAACMQAGREGVLRLFAQASSYVFGRRVQVDLDGTILEGVTDGLDEFGFLRIRKEDGTRQTVYAGSVRPAN
jgi:BirA family biotin operon repressor/biotin-[acetyl-CoA-carboxylase] ligase